MAAEEPRPAALYVSWGGTGRAASLRQAMRRAKGAGRRLHYLALLDNEHFADLDTSMLALVTDELTWLLDSQVELTRRQLGVDDQPPSVAVKAGDVVDLVVDEAARLGRPMILIGAPVPIAGHQSIQSLIDHVRARTGAEVEVVLPDENDQG